MSKLGRICASMSAATLAPAVLLSLPAMAQDKKADKAPIRAQ